jgi:hypothetical protein
LLEEPVLRYTRYSVAPLTDDQLIVILLDDVELAYTFAGVLGAGMSVVADAYEEDFELSTSPL